MKTLVLALVCSLFVLSGCTAVEKLHISQDELSYWGGKCAADSRVKEYRIAKIGFIRDNEGMVDAVFCQDGSAYFFGKGKK